MLVVLLVPLSGRVAGTVTLDGDRLIGNSRGAQSVADAYRRRQVTAMAAFAALSTFNNGYLHAETVQTR